MLLASGRCISTRRGLGFGNNMKDTIPVTDQGRNLLRSATNEAARLSQTHATAAHVLMSIEKHPPTFAEYILNDVGIDVDTLRQAIEGKLSESASSHLSFEGIAA